MQSYEIFIKAWLHKLKIIKQITNLTNINTLMVSMLRSIFVVKVWQN